MANIGKRFLSAFVEVTEDEMPAATQEKIHPPSTSINASTNQPAKQNEKFTAYFDQLFKDANLPGPDYFEFTKMTDAMMVIADEKARYTAAFAGLNVQGLSKEKLLQTAKDYLQLLETDASNFNATVNAALQEKVSGKQQEIEANSKRIQQLTQEINTMQQSIAQLQEEVKENEQKIYANSSSYNRASAGMKQKITGDIEKIEQHIL